MANWQRTLLSWKQRCDLVVHSLSLEHDFQVDMPILIRAQLQQLELVHDVHVHVACSRCWDRDSY